MVSIIITLEEQIVERLEEARQEIMACGDADGEIAAAIEDIREYCRAVDKDVQLMVNSGW